jgi:hypothetical protein
MSTKITVPADFILLAHLPRMLVTEYGVLAHAVPSYRRISYDAICMRIPTEMIGKRYYVRSGAVSAVIKHYGLTSIAVDPQPVATAA